MSLEHQIALPPKRSGGLDGRSRNGRRLKQLVQTYSVELGQALTALQRQSIVRAARLTAISEDLQHRHLQGEAIDVDLLVRADSTARRAVRDLGLRPPHELEAARSLRAFMAAKYGSGDTGG
jgi:hypothetical protein